MKKSSMMPLRVSEGHSAEKEEGKKEALNCIVSVKVQEMYYC